MGVKTADFFRALDDSDLGPYEVRYLLRVWRRGKCWEKLQSIAKSTGISVGKVSEVRRNLLAAGWLAESVDGGRVVYEVALPDCCSVSLSENNFHEVKQDFHQVKQDFHVVRALPINRQNEDNNMKNTQRGSTPDELERQEKQAAWDATVTLIEFWEQITKRKHPPVESEAFRDSWFKPFNEIWITCDRSIEMAKAKIQATRDALLADGRKIFDPAKLPAHVQAMVDTELLPITRRMNGNGMMAQPMPVLNIQAVDGLY